MVDGNGHTGLNPFCGEINHVFPERHLNSVGPIIRGRVENKLGAITKYLVICGAMLPSSLFRICHSICLYIAYIANLSHDRLRARPVCCTGPDNVHCHV